MAAHPYADPLYEAIGLKIRAARIQARYTQAGLAAALVRGQGVTRTTINNLENGRQFVPLPILYEIAGLFQLRIDELLPPREAIETLVMRPRISQNLGEAELRSPAALEALARVQGSRAVRGGQDG